MTQDGNYLFIDDQRVSERQFPTRYKKLRSWVTDK